MKKFFPSMKFVPPRPKAPARDDPNFHDGNSRPPEGGPSGRLPPRSEEDTVAVRRVKSSATKLRTSRQQWHKPRALKIIEDPASGTRLQLHSTHSSAQGALDSQGSPHLDSNRSSAPRVPSSHSSAADVPASIEEQTSTPDVPACRDVEHTVVAIETPAKEADGYCIDDANGTGVAGGPLKRMRIPETPHKGIPKPTGRKNMSGGSSGPGRICKPDNSSPCRRRIGPPPRPCLRVTTGAEPRSVCATAGLTSSGGLESVTKSESPDLLQNYCEPLTEPMNTPCMTAADGADARNRECEASESLVPEGVMTCVYTKERAAHNDTRQANAAPIGKGALEPAPCIVHTDRSDRAPSRKLEESTSARVTTNRCLDAAALTASAAIPTDSAAPTTTTDESSSEVPRAEVPRAETSMKMVHQPGVGTSTSAKESRSFAQDRRGCKRGRSSDSHPAAGEVPPSSPICPETSDEAPSVLGGAAGSFAAPCSEEGLALGKRIPRETSNPTPCNDVSTGLLHEVDGGVKHATRGGNAQHDVSEASEEKYALSGSTNRRGGQARTVEDSSTADRSPSASERDTDTPPERKFERTLKQVYKSAAGGQGRHRGGRRSGRGSRAPAVVRGAKRSFAGLPLARGRLLGGWRMERGSKEGRGRRVYVTQTGRRLTGREAYEAAQDDKRARALNGGRIIVDRTTIMRAGSAGQEKAESSPTGVDHGESNDEVLKLTTYGMPDQVVASYAQRGVRQLFPWQAHCLCVDGGKPLAGGNLVYSAPTSGGKTLVAELLIMRALLQHNGTMALLVVPFVALAMEKRDYLRDVWAPLQLNVQAFHASEGGDEGAMDGVNVAVCTMEKANSFVNRLTEEQRLEALSAVVVDEMHLIADGQRGFLLELMLSKLRMVCPTKVQIVCLSATLPNIDRIAKWLQASLYKTDFRPVGLKHGVCKSRNVYKMSDSGPTTDNGMGKTLVPVQEGDIRKVGDTSQAADPDGVVDLVKDALEKDMSVLVFCATKRWCQTTAALLANEILAERSRGLAMGRDRAASESSRAVIHTAKEEQRTTRQASAPTKRRSTGCDTESAAVPVGGKRLSVTSASSRRDLAGQSADSVPRLKFISANALEGSTVAKEMVKVDRNNTPTLASQQAAGATALSSAHRGSHVTHDPQTADPTANADATRVRERLRETPVGLDTDLAHLVEAGVAFHHSGLVLEERAILEDEFRQGAIRVLVATSTLAAGVNLPAHRVIIRSPNIGVGRLDSTRYHQMAGRSGRTGVSRGHRLQIVPKALGPAGGESFLIIPKGDKMTIADASKLVSSPLPELKSVLTEAKGGGLERALLEVIVGKVVRTKADASRFVAHTFFAHRTEPHILGQACQDAVLFLAEQSFIVVVGGARDKAATETREDDGGYTLAPTQLGQATCFSGLSPLAAVDVHRSLDRACDNLVVATELHALYLVTPLDGLEPDWRRFREEYLGYTEADAVRVVGKAVGIEDGVLVSAAGYSSPRYGKRYYESRRGCKREVDLQPYRRFFAALVLQQVVEEVPIRNMAERLGIERGTLQGLQRDAQIFCGMIVCFCRHLQWHELANVLQSFQDRLAYSAKPELLPLVRLSRDLPPFRARALLQAGYRSPVELAGADNALIADVFLRCLPFRSAGWDESAARHQARQARRLAGNIVHLANKEVVRQLRSKLSGVGAASASTPRQIPREDRGGERNNQR